MTVTRSRTPTTKRTVSALCLVAILMAGCGVAPPSRGPEASGSQDLVIGVLALPVLNGVNADLLTDRLIYNGLYRYDNTYQVRPDLAEAPCVPSVDHLRLTCQLRPASFHDGSAVTSADVQFTYQLANSPECRTLLCLGDVGTSLDRLDTPDERTVIIVLAEPDPGVAAVALPTVPIESRAVTLAAYEAFSAKVNQVEGAELDRLAEEMRAELDRDSPACDRDLGRAERLLVNAGAVVPDRGEFTVGDTFDACPYADLLTYQLESVVASIGAEGVDSIAAAYPVLGLYQQPVGTGPWRVVSRTPGESVLFEAFDGYHFGRPKIDRVRLAVMTANAATARLDSGTVDWWYSARGEAQFRQLRELRNATVFSYPVLADLALQYNLRDGQLFADLNLRKAMELCIDKESSVDAATNGAAIVATSAIPRPSWAHKDQPIPKRDVGEAKRLIESSGWALAPDGVYAKDGRRLEAPVVVWEVPPDGPFGRTNFLGLLVAQAKDCGMDLAAYPVPFRDILQMIDEFPHLVPGQKKPFDLYLGGRNLLEDPNDPSFESSEISSQDQPRGANYIGFDNPQVDEVLAAARASVNVDERARLYGTFQDVVYEQRAMLFVYSIGETTALSKRVVAGGRPLDSEYWWWQLETLELAAQP